MTRILVTPRSLTAAPPPELDPLRRAGFELVFGPAGRLPEEEDLRRLLPGCTGWLAGVEPVPPALLDAAPSLRIIARNGSGTDNLPLEACARRGIRVTRAAGANAPGVAELTVALMLAACRHLPETVAGLRAGGWPRLPGREIAGSRVAIIGMGAIGRRVARILAAMEARLLAHDPLEPAPGPGDPPVAYLPLDEALSRAGILTLHCPMTADGEPLLDARRIARLPEGCILVNTARAGLVEETALLRALDAGHVAAYATDVFAEEPPRDRSLAAHPRVIGTSHVGALTDGSVRRATQEAVAQLLAVLAPSGRAI